MPGGHRPFSFRPGNWLPQACQTEQPPVVIPGAAALSSRQRRELWDLWRTVLRLHGIGGTEGPVVYRFTYWELLQFLAIERISRV